MIPKIIHQIFLGTKNPLPKEWLDTWRNMYEPLGWEYKLWTDDNLPPLINQDIFDREERFHTKGNLVRYELIYRYGGFHADADSIALKPITDEMLANEFFGCYESEKWTGDLIPSCFFGAEERHPILESLIENMKHQDQTKHSWLFNGTAYFTQEIEKYQGQKIIYPSYYFNPVHFRDNRDSLESQQRVSRAYGNHFWNSTKNKWKTTRK